MALTILFGGFLLLLVIGAPLAVALGLAGSLAILDAQLGILSVPTNVYAGIAKYPLLAIPVFILAGLIFERAGVAKQLVTFASSIVGAKNGGLAVVAILVCMVMGGISGSGPADAAAVATVMIPSMHKAGYPKPFSASVIAAAAATAILIPPSVAFIIYSVLVPQASVPALFAAGMVPGILAGLSLLAPTIWLSRKHGFGLKDAGPRPPFWRSLRQAIWGLLAPVIILGGLRTGAFTPTEAAVVAVFYGLAVGVFVYRSLTWRELYEVLAEAAEMSAVVLLIIALSSVFAWAGSTMGAFDRVAALAIEGVGSEVLVLLLLNLALLALGMVLDAVSIFLILLPLLTPIMTAFHWDPVWFGVMLTMNLAIGQFTPPMAVNLMVTTRVAGISMESTVRWVLWMVAAMLCALVLVTFVPELALWLPRKLGYL
ncbi:TRAP transporter large permease [Azospirillum brasilense]|uniref:TRAP transporter large permease protein n=1 Tax=Azospirillum brasilense TaxID=192 RepID=A0A0P0F5Y2_AZOBR|nr:MULTISPECIES: TRAP transporter large permease [Azospirillum]ALJ36244.1 C4-dicarboxylate ABC transporter [Azospirillum brasilense]MDW7552693.1 TRAP transporter large permease [Azospirillum brasilense]MDW7592115.1 TRAP transporter large permease [Azospirillum brasilense]MDW7627246.1 TRAP transporter large permease [Azospirillum brasilense]MDX5955065.1 TRAP transporter large permease [Azospirillum brasilense]